MALTILYHGTDIDSAKDICDAQEVDVTRGAKHTDFGQGFYVTDDYERAVKWAKHKASVRGKKAAVVTLSVDLVAASSLIESFEDDIRWGRFIINNRNGMKYIKNVSFQDNNLDARYPITYGRISDIDVRDVAKELNDTGKMLNSLDRILNKNYSMQYAFHTKEAAGYIKKLTYKSV